MNGLQLVNMSKSIADTMQLDKDMFREAAEKIAADKEDADGRLAPGKARRIRYDWNFNEIQNFVYILDIKHVKLYKKELFKQLFMIYF